MPLTPSRAGDHGDQRANRWTITIVAAGLLTSCALGAGVARARAEAGRGADARHVSSFSDGGADGGGTGPASDVRHRRHLRCPTGAVPSVVIDAVRVHPALDDGLWLHRGRYHIAVRGHLVNDTDAAVDVRGVRWRVEDRPWRASTRFPRVIRPDSSEKVVTRGALASTGRERMALAGGLAWEWRDPQSRSCGRSGLAADD